jgi:hypothetical protein
MPAEISPVAAQWQQWPCGPECAFARPMTNTYGEWLWCQHPQLGGHAAHAGHDCPYYRATAAAEPGPTLVFKRD